MGNVITYHRMIVAVVMRLLLIPPTIIVIVADTITIYLVKIFTIVEAVAVLVLPVLIVGLVANTTISMINNQAMIDYFTPLKLGIISTFC